MDSVELKVLFRNIALCLFVATAATGLEASGDGGGSSSSNVTEQDPVTPTDPEQNPDPI